MGEFIYMVSKNAVSEYISKICIMLFFCSFLFFPNVFAYDVSEYTTFTSQDQFIVPDYNGAISFAAGGSYRNASLVDNIWRFEGLILASSPAVFPGFEGHNFSVYTRNSEVNITHYDTPEIFPPYSGILEYTVSGVGNQGFNLEYHYNEWLSYSVIIDGEEKTQNDGWTVSNDGWINVSGAKSTVKIHYEKASVDFNSEDVFVIPEYNSSINFAFDGTYVYAKLNKNRWRFQNLIADDHAFTNRPTWYLGMSAQNCDVTVINYYAPAVSNGVEGIINYTVSGVGTQTIDNNFDRLGSWPMNYTVYVDGMESTENESWTVTEDGWITVTGATSNVTILYHEIIPDWFKDLPPPGGPPDGLINVSGTFFGISTPYVVMTAVTIIIIVALAILMVKLRPKQEPSSPPPDVGTTE